MSPFLLGDDSAGDPPDPIPNSEVKPQRADGTARETLWESRYCRAFFLKTPQVEFSDSLRRFLLLDRPSPTHEAPIRRGLRETHGIITTIPANGVEGKILYGAVERGRWLSDRLP